MTYPGSARYNASQQSYWSLQESALTPSCVVTPTSASDVAEAVRILTNNGRKNDACLFAIKGRTHAPAAGFANVQNGVTIDMTSLNSTVLSLDRSTLSVGGGASWLQVYSYLNKSGLAVAGGRNGQVGVGGLTTGGGISHFTTRVGFACDNVRNFEVVLACGTITNANASTNPDLFKALKGGANNFGVVTRFDLETFPQEQISVTSLVNDIGQRNAMFEAFTKITNMNPFDENASLVMGFLFNATSKAWTISTAAVDTSPDTQSSTFDALKGIPNIKNSTELEWLANYANESATPPLNWLFWTGTYSASAPLMSQMFTILNDTLYGFNPPGGVVWSIAFEPLPTVIAAKSTQKGDNSMGLSPKDGNAFVMLLSPLWPVSSSNDAVETVAREAGAKVNALAQSQNMLHRWQYLNYADPSQAPIKSYGAQNVADLFKVSKKYDPSGVFQKQVPGGFKLL